MNTLKITVFFIFFSHINTLFSQNNNIIPKPLEQTIKQGYFSFNKYPEIVTQFEFNSATTLLKDALMKLNISLEKKSKKSIKFTLNKKLQKEENSLKPDITDRATEEIERSFELRTRDRERKLINKIDSALLRIENGSYGYCEETGEQISLKRLEARPVATMSLEAQEMHEKAEKRLN